MKDGFFEYYSELLDRKIDLWFPESTEAYKIVTEASRYSLKNGGKRIRPILMLEFGKLFGAPEDDVLPFAVALEMIHTYSLIHDDLPCMDNDDLRRGKPSCHKAYGEDTALLAGDALLTESFVVALKSTAEPLRVLNALRVLAERAGVKGMIGGQVLDLSFEKCAPDTEQLKDMYEKKTGALLSAAAEIGCILSGCDAETAELARNYALYLGLAFQIIDDILDVTGNEKLLGKPIGSDTANGKTTFATVYGPEKAKEIAEKLTEDALECLDRFSGETGTLKDLTKYLLFRNF